MARNKYPEETVKKILDVSHQLFREKGYDHTTIQDITDALGMSKGAVYHHFKSKEDILDKLTDRYYDEMGWFRGIRLDSSLTGLEKVRQVLLRLLSDPGKLDLDRLTSSTTMDPKLLTLTLRASVADSGPFLEALIREGIADGSIAVAQPKEFSEAFMILMNLWVGVFSSRGRILCQNALFEGSYRPYGSARSGRPPAFSLPEPCTNASHSPSLPPPPPEEGMPSASGGALPALGEAHRPGL